MLLHDLRGIHHVEYQQQQKLQHLIGDISQKDISEDISQNWTCLDLEILYRQHVFRKPLRKMFYHLGSTHFCLRSSTDFCCDNTAD